MKSVAESLQLKHGLQKTIKNQIILNVENKQGDTPSLFLEYFL